MTSPEVVILPFNTRDQDSVFLFWQEIWREMGWPVQLLDKNEDVTKLFHFPDGVFLIIKKDGKLVGCGGMKKLDEKTALLKRFYVSQQLRGAGVAEILLFRLIEEARSRGLSNVVLDVTKKNTRAINFYKKHGFVPFDPNGNDWSTSWLESKNDKGIFEYMKFVIN